MLFLFILAGCDWFDQGGDATASVPSALPDLMVEGAVWSAVVTVAHRPDSSRFDSPWPETVAEWRSRPGEFPPTGQMAEEVCGGVPGAREQLLERLQQAPHAEWGDLLDGCARQAHCDWMAEHVLALPSVSAQVLWRGLMACRGPAVQRLAEEAAPDPVVLQAAYSFGNVPVPRLESAILSMAAAGDGALVSVGLRALGEQSSSEAVAALLRMHEQLPPAFEDAAGHAMWRRRDAPSRRRHRAACRRRSHALCATTPTGEEPEAPDLFAAMADPSLDPRTLAGEFATSPLLGDALESCVYQSLGAKRGRARLCIRVLVQHAPETAEELASVLDAYDVPDLVTALRSTKEELAARLVAAGVSGTSQDAPAGVFTAADLLVAWGVGLELKGEGPNQDPVRTMLRLSRLALGAQSDFRFSVVEPRRSDASTRGGRQILYGWMDGLRLRTLSEPDSPLHGLEHQVGLVNAMLERRGASARLGVTSADEESVVVVAAPPDVLAALADDQLVTWALPNPSGDDPALLDTGF